MYRKKLNIVGLLMVLLITPSCNEKPLSDINFSENNYTLYFIIPPNNTSSKQTSQFQKSYKNFYIDNSSTLEKIQKQIIQRKNNNNDSSELFYALRLVQGKYIVDGAILDVKNNDLLYHNEKYSFAFSEFEKLSDEFKPLSSLEVTCFTTTDAVKLLDYINSNDGYIYSSSLNRENPHIQFKGKVELITDAKNIDFSSRESPFGNKVKNDFKNVGEIRIIELSYDGDSINVSMIWEYDYTPNLPKGYKVVKAFTDSIEIPTLIYNLKKEDIISFFERSGIKAYNIKDLN